MVFLQQAEKTPPYGGLYRPVAEVGCLPVEGAAQKAEGNLLFFHHTVSMKVFCTRLKITMPMVSSTTMNPKLYANMAQLNCP